MAVEIAEITQKVLDWQTSNPRFSQEPAQEVKEDIDEEIVEKEEKKDKDVSELGTIACKRYLDFIEEIS